MGVMRRLFRVPVPACVTLTMREMPCSAQEQSKERMEIEEMKAEFGRRLFKEELARKRVTASRDKLQMELNVRSALRVGSGNLSSTPTARSRA